MEKQRNVVYKLRQWWNQINKEDVFLKQPFKGVWKTDCSNKNTENYQETPKTLYKRTSHYMTMLINDFTDDFLNISLTNLFLSKALYMKWDISSEWDNSPEWYPSKMVLFTL